MNGANGVSVRSLAEVECDPGQGTALPILTGKSVKRILKKKKLVTPIHAPVRFIFGFSTNKGVRYFLMHRL